MQKGFAPILALIVIVVFVGVVGGAFYFSQKINLDSPQKLIPQNLKPQENKEKDKSYSNQSLGIEFSYPANLILKEESEEEFNKRGNGEFRKNFSSYVGYEPGKFVGAVNLLEKQGDFENAPLTIWVFNNPDNLDPEAWYKKYWYFPFIWGDFTLRSNLIAPTLIATISGQLGGYNIVDYRDGKPQFILVPFKDRMYLLKFPTQNQPEVTGEILESFKFLQSTSENNDEVCIQVITPAKNSKTGECKEFPTPCDVPNGWEKVESCSGNLPQFLE
ncbi:hypothetical protein HYS91_01445 [Candidatus Daviesbacteria bacterium]|nr:hypothetical protein [Candidatus Daviesbacteria bacterium]